MTLKTPSYPTYQGGGSSNSSFSNAYPQAPKIPTYPTYPKAPTYPTMPTYPQYPQGSYYEIQRRRKQLAYKKSLTEANPFKDPYAINSLSDVLFNNAAKEKRYGNIDNVFSYLNKTTHALFDHVSDNFVKPVMSGQEGGLQLSGVNALTSIAEDLGFVGNIVKGTILETDVGTDAAVAGGIGAALGAIAAVGITAATGGAAAVAGGLAVAAKAAATKVGFVLMGTLTGAGVAATGAAINKSPERALEGFRKAVGMGDAGRTNYEIETGKGLIADILVDMALDPGTWVNFGLSASAKAGSSALKEAIRLNRVSTKTGALTFAESLKAADSLADYLYTGLRGLDQLENYWIKASFNATPIGPMWFTAKQGYKYGTSVLADINLKMNPVQKKAAPVQFRKADIDSFFSEKIDPDMIPDPLTVDKAVKRKVDLADDIQTSIRWEKRLNTNVPDDFSPLDKIAGDMLDAIKKTDPMMHPDNMMSDVADSLLTLMSSGKLNDLHPEYPEFFKKLLADPENALEFTKDILIRYKTDDIFSDAMKRSVKTFRKRFAEETMAGLDTKLSVLQQMESVLAKSMGASGDVQLGQILHMMANSDHNVAAYYEPLLHEIERMMDAFGITIEELTAYVRRGPQDMPYLKTLSESVTQYAGIKPMVDSVDGVPLAAGDKVGAQIKDIIADDFTTKDFLTDFTEEKLQEVIANAQDSSVFRKYVQNQIGDVGTVMSFDEYINSTRRQAMFKVAGKTNEIQKVVGNVTRVMNDLQKFAPDMYKKLDDAKLVQKFGDMTTSLGTFKRFSDTIDSMSNTLMLNNSIKDPIRLNTDNPAVTLELIEKAIKKLPTEAKTAAVIEDYVALQSMLKDVIDTGGKVFDELASLVDVISKAKEEAGKTVASTQQAKFLDRTLKWLTDGIKKLGVDQALVPQHTYYRVQLSKNNQYMMMAASVMDSNPKLFKAVKDPDSYIRQLEKRFKNLDMRETAFQPMKEAFLETTGRLRGASSYLDLASNIRRLASTVEGGSSHYDEVMDFLMRYTNSKGINDPAILLNNLKNPGSDDAVKFMQRMRGKVGMSDKMMYAYLEVIREYLDELVEAGAKSIVYLPGTGFSELVNNMKPVLSEFLSGLPEYSKAAVAVNGIGSIGDTLISTLTNINAINASTGALDTIVKANDTAYNKIVNYNTGSKLLGIRSLDNANYGDIARKAAKVKEEFIFSGDGLTVVERLQNEVTAKLSESLAKLDHQGIYVGLYDATRGDQFEKVAKALKQYTHVSSYKLAKHGFDDTTKQVLRTSQTKSQALFEPIIEFTRRLDANESALRPKFEQKTFYNRANRNLSNIVTSMNGDELASFIKYNTVNDMMIIDKRLMIRSFSDTINDELAKYGLQVKSSFNYYAIVKAVDTPEYAAVEQMKRIFTRSSEYADAPNNFKAAKDLTRKMTKSLGYELNIDPSVANFGRPDTDKVAEFLTNNSEIYELLGEDVVNDYLGKAIRERGYKQSLVMPRDVMEGLFYTTEQGVNAMAQSGLKMTLSAAMNVTYQQNEAIRFVQTLLNEDNSLARLFKGKSAQDIFDQLKDHKEMRIAYLNAKGKVKTLPLASVRDVQRALDSGGVLTDVNTAMRMNNKLSPFKISDLHPSVGVPLDIYQRYIAPWHNRNIFTAGATMRNAWDALIMKNPTINADTLNPALIAEVYEDFEFIQKMAEFMKGDLNSMGIAKYIEEAFPGPDNKIMRARMSRIVDFTLEFDLSPASGGIIAAQADKRLADALASGSMKAPSIAQKVAYGDPITKFFMNTFSDVESFARYLLARAELKIGGTLPGIEYKVLQAHFAYDNKNMFESLLNIFRPFASFPMRNLMFWGTEGFNNARLLNTLISVSEETVLQDDYKMKEIQEGNQFLLSQALSGNPTTFINGYNMTLKLNPSLFDAMRIIPETLSSPVDSLNPLIKNAVNVASGNVTKWDELEYPYKADIMRAGNLINKHIPNIQSAIAGVDEDWRLIPGVMQTLFTVSKLSNEKVQGLKNSNFIRTPRVYHRNAYKRSGFVNFGEGVDAYRVKGGHALSMGYVNKAGKFRASGGIGYGNPAIGRQWNENMHIRFGKWGPWLANAPVGVRLKNPNKGRTLYEKMYSKKGNARMASRMRQFQDPRGLMFTLQDMRYNVY